MHIRPNSIWVAYTLTNPLAVRHLLPSGMELAHHPLLQDEQALAPSPKLLFNAYEVDSSWMRGVRVDILLLARRMHENTLHLVVLDCFTNTLRWNPIAGVERANAYVRDSSQRGSRYRLHMRSATHRFAVDGQLERSRPIDWRFSVEANRVCYFGGSDTPYPMCFDEATIGQPVRNLRLSTINNSLWSGVRTARPSHAFLHPHAMDFDVTVPSFRTEQ